MTSNRHRSNTRVQQNVAVIVVVVVVGGKCLASSLGLFCIIQYIVTCAPECRRARTHNEAASNTLHNMPERACDQARARPQPSTYILFVLTRTMASPRSFTRQFVQSLAFNFTVARTEQPQSAPGPGVAVAAPNFIAAAVLGLSAVSG